MDATPLAGAPSGVVARVMRAPLAFEPNTGQAPPDVRYVGRGLGYRLWLTPTEALLAPASDGDEPTQTLRLRLVGASPAAVPSAENKLGGRVHYYTGGSPDRWRLDVPTYARVAYRDVYPGVDLVFHGSQQELEFDFVVAPGADPGPIALDLVGADHVSTDGEDVVALVAGTPLRLHKPVVYQETTAGRTAIDARFTRDGRRIALELGAYDRDRALVIDPVVTYATYLGRPSGDRGVGVGIDAAGNMYVANRSGIVKLSADGSTLLYSVVLGDMVPAALAVDAAGNAYVASLCPYPRSGVTFYCPTTPNALVSGGHPTAQGDAATYVTKLSPDGSTLVYSSTIGGNGFVEPAGIAVDPAGNIYVAAWNAYGGFPVTRAPFALSSVTTGFPAFVEAIAADASRLLYAVEFLTGGDFFRPTGLAVDATGAVYLTGASGNQFPTTPNAFQPTTGTGIGAGVVAKIAPDASALVYATYFGNRATVPHSIAVDSDGNAYIAGQAGPGLPTANAIQPALAGATDAFVARLDATGSSLVFSTYLGGTGDDSAAALGLDSSTNIYVAGTTRSTDFPQVGALPPQFGTVASNFVAQMTPDGQSLVYSTYFADSQTDISALATNAGGTVYLTGGIFLTGGTTSAFPTVAPYQATPAASFLAVIEPAEPRVFFTGPAAGATVSGTVWTDIWVENTVGSSNTFTLSVAGTVVATQTTPAVHVTLAWDSRAFPDGPQTMTATVRDAATHVGTTSRAVTVQNGTPTPALAVSFTAPPAGATVSGTVTVAVAATGASGTPITFTLSVDGTQTFVASGTAATAAFSWNSTTVASGGHILGVTVRDGAGRTATATRSVTVGGTPSPATLGVYITSPAPGATVSGTVWSDIWVEGAAAGNRTFTLAIGGVALVTTTDSSSHVTLPWDSTRVGNGAQTLTATVRDASGNSGTGTRPLNLQNAGVTPPPPPPPPPPPAPTTFSVYITQPRSGNTVSGTVWLVVWIDGAASGSKTYTLTEGGRTIVTTTTTSSGPVSMPWVTTAADNGSRAPTVSVQDGSGGSGQGTITVTVAN